MQSMTRKGEIAAAPPRPKSYIASHLDAQYNNNCDHDWGNSGAEVIRIPTYNNIKYLPPPAYVVYKI